MSAAPLTFAWDGEAMRPLPHLAKLADKIFIVGERYRLEEVQQRSRETHSHFFACVDEAWASLPEVHANRWRTPDHLRRWALIQAGFCNETTYIATSKAEALRMAAFMHSLDEFAEVEVQGNLMAHRVAKSQSQKAMPGKEFQASKQGVLDVLAKLIGVSSDELAKQGTAA